MNYYAALDVSLRTVNLCVMSACHAIVFLAIQVTAS